MLCDVGAQSAGQCASVALQSWNGATLVPTEPALHTYSKALQDLVNGIKPKEARVWSQLCLFQHNLRGLVCVNGAEDQRKWLWEVAQRSTMQEAGQGANSVSFGTTIHNTTPTTMSKGILEPDLSPSHINREVANTSVGTSQDRICNSVAYSPTRAASISLQHQR